MNQTKVIISQFLKVTLRSKALVYIYIVWLVFIVFAAFTGYKNYIAQHTLLTNFQQQARESWKANPDKHPHRMAHFGSFAFRLKHPLSMFDQGMESYTGNAVFLEAHRQNTVNFSEAGFSTGLLRFGEISQAMLLQLILPLILFFVGFNAISQQKENGTLKILLNQGPGFRTLIWGNSLGLFTVSLIFLLPVAIGVCIQLSLTEVTKDSTVSSRSIGLLLAFLAYLWVACTVAICISANSKDSRTSLLKLLGVWLIMAIVLPRTLQAIGNASYPAPGKIEFEAALEIAILQIGDSHNPNDPHFKQLKDSLLNAYHVDSTAKLPFNYSGFQMHEGERLSAEIYNNHLRGLYHLYEHQNDLSRYAAIIDPLISIKNISMALSGTDFAAYKNFQDEAEKYRYQLSQTMNDLQMKYIGNGKDHQRIGKEHWAAFPDFHYTYLQVKQSLEMAILSGWFLVSFLLIYFTAANAKAI